MRALIIVAALLGPFSAFGELNAQGWAGVELGQRIRIRTAGAASPVVGTLMANYGDSVVTVEVLMFAAPVPIRVRDVVSLEVSRAMVGPWKWGAVIGGLVEPPRGSPLA